MPTLTSEQAMELARNYLKLAQAVNTFRIEKWDLQTEDQRATLKALHWEITTYVDELVVLSVTLILEDAEHDLLTIQSITDDISATIRRIERVQKVIDVATAIVGLGGAIVSKDPKAIGKGIHGLAKAWNEKLPSEKQPDPEAATAPENKAVAQNSVVFVPKQQEPDDPEIEDAEAARS